MPCFPTTQGATPVPRGSPRSCSNAHSGRQGYRPLVIVTSFLLTVDTLGVEGVGVTNTEVPYAQA